MADFARAMANDPVFIVGTERSGSNLLRLILDAHSKLVIPHPPHVMNYFAALEPRYGDLSDPPRFRRLVDDVLALVRAHIHPWPWVPEAGEIVERARTHDVFGVYVALHEALRDHEGKARWGCKSTFMIAHVPRILQAFPRARLLWLYRDPRDVAASSRESVFSAFHPYYTAQLWAHQQAQGLAAEALAPEGVLRLPYEALVGAPERELRRVCDWMGEDFEPAMLQWFRRDEARRSATLSESWANTASPMQTARQERWRKDLSTEEVVAVEAVARREMAALGYAPVTATETLDRWSIGPVTRARYWASDRASWAKVEARSWMRDKNVARRWRRAWLLRGIRARLVLRGG